MTKGIARGWKVSIQNVGSGGPRFESPHCQQIYLFNFMFIKLCASFCFRYSVWLPSTHIKGKELEIVSLFGHERQTHLQKTVLNMMTTWTKWQFSHPTLMRQQLFLNCKIFNIEIGLFKKRELTPMRKK